MVCSLVMDLVRHIAKKKKKEGRIFFSQKINTKERKICRRRYEIINSVTKTGTSWVNTRIIGKVQKIFSHTYHRIGVM